VTYKNGLGVRLLRSFVNGTIRHSAYDILLTFYSEYGSISCHFWDIQCWKMLCPWNRCQTSLKVIESGTIR